MKTLLQVTNEITALAKDFKALMDVHDVNSAKQIQSRIDQLKFFKLYLETNPNPEFVKKMRDDVSKHLSIIESRFGQWCTGKSEDRKVLLARYNSLMNVGELKNKLKALNYLCE